MRVITERKKEDVRIEALRATEALIESLKANAIQQKAPSPVPAPQQLPTQATPVRDLMNMIQLNYRGKVRLEEVKKASANPALEVALQQSKQAVGSQDVAPSLLLPASKKNQ